LSRLGGEFGIPQRESGESRVSGSSLDFCVLFIKKKNKETAGQVLIF
jgi:hypothetical protein